MSAGRPWRLDVVDNGRLVFGSRGLPHNTLSAAMNNADKHYRRSSCRVEHAANGERWHRRAGTWIKERNANDPGWLAQRDNDLGASRADGRPSPSS